MAITVLLILIFIVYIYTLNDILIIFSTIFLFDQYRYNFLQAQNFQIFFAKYFSKLYTSCKLCYCFQHQLCLEEFQPEFALIYDSIFLIQGSKAQPWWLSHFLVSERVLFGTWDGVFTSCLINIFGVIVFLRSGWIVGEAGIGHAGKRYILILYYLPQIESPSNGLRNQ